MRWPAAGSLRPPSVGSLCPSGEGALPDDLEVRCARPPCGTRSSALTNPLAAICPPSTSAASSLAATRSRTSRAPTPSPARPRCAASGPHGSSRRPLPRRRDAMAALYTRSRALHLLRPAMRLCAAPRPAAAFASLGRRFVLAAFHRSVPNGARRLMAAPLHIDLYTSTQGRSLRHRLCARRVGSRSSGPSARLRRRGPDGEALAYADDLGFLAAELQRVVKAAVSLKAYRKALVVSVKLPKCRAAPLRRHAGDWRPVAIVAPSTPPCRPRARSSGPLASATASAPALRSRASDLPPWRRQSPALLGSTPAIWRRRLS